VEALSSALTVERHITNTMVSIIMSTNGVRVKNAIQVLYLGMTR